MTGNRNPDHLHTIKNNKIYLTVAPCTFYQLLIRDRGETSNTSSKQRKWKTRYIYKKYCLCIKKTKINLILGHQHQILYRFLKTTLKIELIIGHF